MGDEEDADGHAANLAEPGDGPEAPCAADDDRERRDRLARGRVQDPELRAPRMSGSLRGPSVAGSLAAIGRGRAGVGKRRRAFGRRRCAGRPSAGGGGRWSSVGGMVCRRRRGGVGRRRRLRRRRLGRRRRFGLGLLAAAQRQCGCASASAKRRRVDGCVDVHGSPCDGAGLRCDGACVAERGSLRVLPPCGRGWRRIRFRTSWPSPSRSTLRELAGQLARLTAASSLLTLPSALTSRSVKLIMLRRRVGGVLVGGGGRRRRFGALGERRRCGKRGMPAKQRASRGDDGFACASPCGMCAHCEQRNPTVAACDARPDARCMRNFREDCENRASRSGPIHRANPSMPRWQPREDRAARRSIRVQRRVLSPARDDAPRLRPSPARARARPGARPGRPSDGGRRCSRRRW